MKARSAMPAKMLYLMVTAIWVSYYAMVIMVWIGVHNAEMAVDNDAFKLTHRHFIPANQLAISILFSVATSLPMAASSFIVVWLKGRKSNNPSTLT